MCYAAAFSFASQLATTNRCSKFIGHYLFLNAEDRRPVEESGYRYTGKDCEMLRDECLEESILLVEQITTIDKMVLCNRLCRVTSARKKQEIEAAVKKQFAMQACTGREAQA